MKNNLNKYIQINILLTISIIILPISNFSSPFDKDKEVTRVDETWSFPLFAVAIITVILGVLVFYLEPKVKSKETVKQGCETLKEAIEENKRDLTENRGYQIFEVKIIENSKEISHRCVNVYLDLTPYETIFHSGFFAHFCPKTQYYISSLYNALKFNNEVLNRINNLKDLESIFIQNTNINNENKKNANFNKRVEEHKASLFYAQDLIKKYINTILQVIDIENKTISLFNKSDCKKIESIFKDFEKEVSSK